MSGVIFCKKNEVMRLWLFSRFFPFDSKSVLLFLRVGNFFFVYVLEIFRIFAIEKDNFQTDEWLQCYIPTPKKIYNWIGRISRCHGY
jgi:hypothetical protein